jgi:hypothetical protein
MTLTLSELEFTDWIQAISLSVFLVAGLLVASPGVVALIAVIAFFGLIPARFRIVVTATLIGAFLLNGLVGNALFPAFAARYPSLPEWAASARLAGLIEPVTTKFLPAGFLLWYFHNHSPDTVDFLRRNSWRSGALLGFSFGLMEALLKVVKPTGVYGDVSSVTVTIFIATWLHLFTGFLVAGAVFQWWGRDPDPSYRQWIFLGVKIGIPLTTAMGVHYFWNVGGRALIYEPLGFA